MFVPVEFKEHNILKATAFIQQNPFGILVADNEQLHAVHIPFMLEEKKGSFELMAHVAKQNPVSKIILEAGEGLAIFHGAHAYISSSWYESDNVSTWNYIAVHVYGKFYPFNETEKLEAVKLLTNHYESENPKGRTWDKISPKKINALLPHIVAFKMTNVRWEAKFKLSQNRSEKDFQNIIHHLERSSNENDKLIAEAMRQL